MWQGRGTEGKSRGRLTQKTRDTKGQVQRLNSAAGGFRWRTRSGVRSGHLHHRYRDNKKRCWGDDECLVLQDKTLDSALESNLVSSLWRDFVVGKNNWFVFLSFLMHTLRRIIPKWEEKSPGWNKRREMRKQREEREREREGRKGKKKKKKKKQGRERLRFRKRHTKVLCLTCAEWIYFYIQFLQSLLLLLMPTANPWFARRLQQEYRWRTNTQRKKHEGDQRRFSLFSFVYRWHAPLDLKMREWDGRSPDANKNIKWVDKIYLPKEGRRDITEKDTTLTREPKRKTVKFEAEYNKNGRNSLNSSLTSSLFDLIRVGKSNFTPTELTTNGVLKLH